MRSTRGVSLIVAGGLGLLVAGVALGAPPERWTKAAPTPEERTEVAVAADGPRPAGSYSAANEVFTP